MTYKRNPAIVSSGVGRETLALNEKAGRYFTLNETASAIWEVLQRESNFDEVCAYLADRYDADLDTVRRDSETILNVMIADGLVVVSDDASA